MHGTATHNRILWPKDTSAEVENPWSKLTESRCDTTPCPLCWLPRASQKTVGVKARTVPQTSFKENFLVWVELHSLLNALHCLSPTSCHCRLSCPSCGERENLHCIFEREQPPAPVNRILFQVTTPSWET